MITELSAQNFKSWQDTGELQFAPLTGFFGANSSGKSSISADPTSAQADYGKSTTRNRMQRFTLVMIDSIIDLR